MISTPSDFGRNIATIALKLGAKTELVAQKIVGELFKRVVERTPVDTGRLRGNWNVSVGEPNTSTSETAENAGRADAVENEVGGIKVSGNAVFLSNGLPYAGVVEYGGYPNPPKFGSHKRGEDGMAIHVKDGYSMQAPQGMVRVSLAEIETIMAKALE